MSDLNYTLPFYPCEFCGQVTKDYWYLNKSLGLCRCRKCSDAGITETEQEKNRINSYRFNPSYSRAKSSAVSVAGVASSFVGDNLSPCWMDYALTVRKAASVAEVSCTQDTANERGALLSKSHNRPFGEIPRGKNAKPPSLTWRDGASILKASQGSDGRQRGGAERGSIQGFSASSRRRLMYAIASIRRDADLPCFVTLTYPKTFPSPKESKRHLKMFCQRLQRAYTQVSAIWKLEPQERGAPHYHLLVWGVDVQELKHFVPYAWHDIAGQGDEFHIMFHLGLLHQSKHCVSLVNSFRGVWSYASKYLGKTFEVAGWEEKYTGKFWGYVNRSLIPFGALCELQVTSKSAFHVMRYQRRFSGRKTSNKGFTLFCDADQWIKNIVGGEFAK